MAAGNVPHGSKKVSKSVFEKFVADLEAARNKKKGDKLKKSADKLSGFEFDGVNCSVTKADQDGVIAVLVQLSLKIITTTVFEFSNGSKLLINTENVKRFSLEWAKCRQQFFNQV